MSDYNFLSGVSPERVPGRDIGVREMVGQRQANRQLNRMSPLQRVQHSLALQDIEMRRFSLLEKANSMQMKIRQQEGQSALMGFMADRIGQPDFASEDTLHGMYRIANQYGMTAEEIEPYESRWRASNVRARGMPQGGQGWRQTVTVDPVTGREQHTFAQDPTSDNVKDTRELARLDREAEAERDRLGGDEGALAYQRKMRQADTLRASMKGGGGLDLEFGAGGTLLRARTGGGSDKPTIGMETSAQRQQVSMEHTAELGNALARNLRPMDVGPLGVVGEFAIDRGLANIPAFAGWADKTRISNRMALGTYRDTALKMVQADMTGRFAVADRNAIESLLPSSGVFESHPRVLGAIETLNQIFAMRALIIQDKTGARPGIFALNTNTLESMFASEMASLQARLTAGNITAEQAEAAANSLWLTKIAAVEKVPARYSDVYYGPDTDE